MNWKRNVVMLVLLLCCICGVAFAAKNTTEDGFCYSNAGTYIVITEYIGLADEVVIPSKIDGLPVRTIGSNSFAECDWVTSVSIPEGVEVIQYSAFTGCTNLKNVTIPSSVYQIGVSAFRDCENLVNVHIGDLEDWLKIQFTGRFSTPMCYATNMYAEGMLVTNITIPGDVDSISDYAFYGWSTLSSVSISNGVKTIGDYAFCECTSLVSVALPESVTKIGSYAFSGCQSLVEANIPGNVTKINDGTFQGCSNLKEITIPNAVTSIGSEAFEDCSSMDEVIIPPM